MTLEETRNSILSLMAKMDDMAVTNDSQHIYTTLELIVISINKQLKE